MLAEGGAQSSSSRKNRIHIVQSNSSIQISDQDLQQQPQDSFKPVPVNKRNKRSSKTQLFNLLKLGFLILIFLVLVVFWFNYSKTEPKLKPTGDYNRKQDQDITEKQPASGQIKPAQQHKQQNKQVVQQGTPSVFPKIVWVQTGPHINATSVLQYVNAQNYVMYASKSGFKAKVVNNIEAFDQISPQMAEFVHHTKHKSKAQLDVYQVLKIAELVDQGGLFFSLSDGIVAIEDWSWLQKLFDQKQPDETIDKFKQCKIDKPEVFMFTDGNKRYEDKIIAAIPNSKLLKEVLKEMSQILISGEWPYDNIANIKRSNGDVNSIYFDNLFETLLNIHLGKLNKNFEETCQHYKLQSFKRDDTISRQSACGKNYEAVLTEDKSSVIQSCKYRFFTQGNFGMITNKIMGSINIGDFNQNTKRSIFYQDIMSSPTLKWLTERRPDKRNGHLCIVSLKALQKIQYQSKIQSSLSKLHQQSFKKWNAIYFVKEFEQQSKTHSSDPTATILKASQYEGLNMQTAICKFCQQNTMVLLLDYDQYLASNSDLQVISESVSPNRVYAGLIPLKINDQRVMNSIPGRVVRRHFSPNKGVLDALKNHFRVVSRETYRFIPHPDLHNIKGEYYDREVAFLALLELANDGDRCGHGEARYMLRRIEQFMEIPIDRPIIQNVAIITDKYKSVDISRAQYIGKINWKSLCRTLVIFRNELNYEPQFFNSMNNGQKYTSPAERKDYPKKIPAVIHQIWLKGDIPPNKRYLMDHLKNGHPNFVYKIWSLENITKQNFPQTYELAETLIEFDKRSPYNKLSMIGDVIRNQLIYNQGGFYVDTNFYIFKPGQLEQWRTYKFIGGSQIYPRSKAFKNSAFFAAQPKSKYLYRGFAKKYMSNRNFYGKDAEKISGPGLFGPTVQREEQFDMDILQPSVEEVYPYWPWQEGTDRQNRCSQPSNGNYNRDDIMFEANGRAFKKSCPNIFHFAVAVDFFDMGLSWQKRRNIG